MRCFEIHKEFRLSCWQVARFNLHVYVCIYLCFVVFFINGSEINICISASCLFSGSSTYSADPEETDGVCYYGGGDGQCSTVPDGARFCPCDGGPTAPPTPAPSGPSRVPTLRPSPSPTVGPQLCPPYSASDTNFATQNYATCDIYACGGVTIEASCAFPGASCTSDGEYVTFYLVNSAGEEVSNEVDDDFNIVVYSVPTSSACAVYTLREGCNGDESCSGTIGVTGGTVVASPTTGPTAHPPTVAPSPPITAVQWFQGDIGVSCESVCGSVLYECVSEGYWPENEAQFEALLATSIDLATCSDLSDLSTCEMSTCPTIDEGLCLCLKALRALSLSVFVFLRVFLTYLFCTFVVLD